MKNLCFRKRGDFYETTGPHAQDAAKALGLVTTRRGDEPFMLAIPAHCWGEWSIQLARANFAISMQAAEERMNKGREMIQSFLDDLVDGDDKRKAEYGKRLWDIHDEGYSCCLRDNNMAPPLQDVKI
jgi:DNA mismatch repair ATPase MutS